MRWRPRTLRGRITATSFGLVTAVLALAFVGVDLLLAERIDRDLTGAASAQLRYLEAAVSHHAGEDLVSELATFEQQTGATAQVLRADEVLFASRRLNGLRLPAHPGIVRATSGERYHLAASTVGPYRLAVAVSAGPSEQIHARLRRIMLGCFAIGLVAAAFTARWLAGRTAGPLERLTAATDRVDVQNLEQAIPPDPAPYAEVARLTGAFNEMLERLHAAVTRLRRFVADASHELRTPVAILKTHAQATLADGSIPAETAGYIRDQIQQIDRLEALIADLLLVSRLDASSIDRARVDLSDVVIETVEQMKPLIDRQSLAVSVLVPEPVTVIGDRRQLQRLVTNLMDNAVKHTPAGGRIEVGLTRASGRVRLGVADTGPGIAPTSLPHIFEPFFRGDESRSRESGGAGLGLAIARRISLLHDGRISVDSAPGRGSTFLVELPAVP